MGCSKCTKNNSIKIEAKLLKLCKEPTIFLYPIRNCRFWNPLDIGFFVCWANYMSTWIFCKDSKEVTSQCYISLNIYIYFFTFKIWHFHTNLMKLIYMIYAYTEFMLRIVSEPYILLGMWSSLLFGYLRIIEFHSVRSEYESSSRRPN